MTEKFNKVVATPDGELTTVRMSRKELMCSYNELARENARLAQLTVRSAFVTGSHAYGTPHDKSDVDLVIYVEHEDAQEIAELCEPAMDTQLTYESRAIRIGVLNLIMLDAEDFDAWHEENEAMVAESRVSPISRDEAVRRIKRALGVSDV